MKDPDGPQIALDEAVQKRSAEFPSMSEREREKFEEGVREELSDHVYKWLNYGEYVDFEIDTEAGTATLIKPE